MLGNVKKLHNAKNLITNFFNDYSLLIFGGRQKAAKGEGLKMSV